MFLRLLAKFQTWYRNPEARLETLKEKDKLTIPIGNLNLQTQRQQKEANGSLSSSEYMLVGTYPFAEAPQDLKTPKACVHNPAKPDKHSKLERQLQHLLRRQPPRISDG